MGLGCDVCDIEGITRLCGLSGFIFKVRIFIKFLLISHGKQTSAFKPRDTAGGGEKLAIDGASCLVRRRLPVFLSRPKSVFSKVALVIKN